MKMKEALLTIGCFLLSGSLFAADAEAPSKSEYLGIPHGKSSAQVQKLPDETRQLISRYGTITAVAVVSEDVFWKDVQENQATHIQVLDGQLYYAVRTAEHLSAPAGTPAPWREMLGRRQVKREEVPQPNRIQDENARSE